MAKSSSTTAPSFRWFLILAGCGFAAGFVGPMVLTPQSNLGPLVGILYTGPLGAVLGVLGWLVSSLFKISPRIQWRALHALNIALVGSTLFALLPKPLLRGYVVDGEITRCRRSQELQQESLADWQQRIARVTWSAPTPGWRERMIAALADDASVVVDVNVSRRVEIREHRKPWNFGKRFTVDVTTPGDTRSFYDIATAGSCAAYEAGSALRTFIAYNSDVRPPDEWPPMDIGSILGRSPVESVPSRYQALVTPLR